MPDRVGPAAPGACRHEWLWRLALACGDLVHGAPRADRSIVIKNIVVLAFPRIVVAMFDQEPIGALSTVAVVAHAYQHPAAVQLVAAQREFQVALLEPLLGIVGFPIAAVPELHGAATILVLGNGAFEIAVIKRMVFDFHCQPLVARIERGPPGDRPGFEDAAELQPEIVVQPGRVVLLDHEAPLLRRLHGRVAAGLRGLFEIPLFPVGGEVSQGQDKTRTNENAAAYDNEGPGTETCDSR